MADGGDSEKTVRLVIQQCLSARLKPPPATGDGAGATKGDEEKAIGPGMVVFVCFTKGATEEAAIRAADVVATRLKLCEPDVDSAARETTSKRRTSVLDRPGDILVVPQATLGGKLKGSSVQYHGNVDRAIGQRLYETFVAALRTLSENHPKTSERDCGVLAGVYGARQVLAMETNGPYTHAFQL